MQRLLIATLAAVDAAIAAAVGLATLLAPLTVLWALAFGANADWGALWPVAGTLWQFGHGAPIAVVVPDAVVAATGIAPEAAAFTLSLMPLGFWLFTVLFAARSGTRAARAGAWPVGVGSGILVFAVISVLVALTSHTAIGAVELVGAILLPIIAYAIGALAGAVVYAWNEGDTGIIDRLHDIVDGWGQWSVVPGAVLRGVAVATVSLIAASAVGLVVMVFVRGGEMVALFGSARVDALGVVVFSLAQFAYLPTLIVWGIAWLAGPGFAVGAGTAISPAGTSVGVLPGIPIFGLLPETTSFWTLIVVLVPVAAGAVAGWIVRTHLVWDDRAGPFAPRAAIAAGIGIVMAGIGALLSVMASGSIGPGRLADIGPHPGWVALALGAEVVIGAAILLLAPRNRDELAEERTDRWVQEMGVLPTVDPVLPPRTAPANPDEHPTEPLDDLDGIRNT